MTASLFVAPSDAPVAGADNLGDPAAYTEFHGPHVAAGMAWLDEFDPRWPADVDLDRLGVGSPEDCPAGQALGDFFAADLYVAEAVDLGFVAPIALRPPTHRADDPQAWVEWSARIDREHAQLTEVWRHAIAERRAR